MQNTKQIKKDKNSFKFLFRLHAFPKIPKMLGTDTYEKIYFKHHRQMKIQQILAFWSNREIKMLQNIVIRLNYENIMPLMPKTPLEICKEVNVSPG